MKSAVSSVLITLVAIAIVFGLVSCGVLSQSARALGHKVKSEGGADKKGKFDINEGSGGGRSSLDELRSMNNVKVIGELPREEDIVWAPEDPDVPIAELAGLAAKDDNPVDAWFVDYKKAMQKSRQEGKPLLMWFTSTRNSPFCVALSSELYSKAEFDTWAKENVIRLRVDANVTGKTDAERSERRKYIEDLKRRYKVMGHPVTVMVSPRGTQFGNYRGYKSGQSDFYWGRLKNASRSAQEDYASWKDEMERKGYRVWHNIAGKSIFAKAARYSKGTLWLIEPDGKKSVTPVSRLSHEDNLYINRKIEESRKP